MTLASGNEHPNAVSPATGRRAAPLGALGVVAGAALALLSSACIPTVARTNARVEPGFDLALASAGGLLLEGEDENGNATEQSPEYLHAEIDLQYGWRADDNQGFAVQVKLPITIVFLTLDLFYEFPSSHPWYYGIGGELGAFPALYGSLTRYLSPTTYFTFTGRVSSNLDDEAAATQYNPQVALGFDNGHLDLALYASYAYQTGRGMNVQICLFDSDCGKDYRKEFVLAGIQARF